MLAEGARRAAAKGHAKEEWQTTDMPPPVAITNVSVKEVTKVAVQQTQSDVHRPHAGVPLKPTPRPPTKPLSLAGLCGPSLSFLCLRVAMEKRTAMIAQRRQAREERRRKMEQEKVVRSQNRLSINYTLLLLHVPMHSCFRDNMYMYMYVHVCTWKCMAQKGQNFSV